MATLIDLFAGCGGLSLGMELVGFEPVLACELSRSAQATYRKNRELWRKREEWMEATSRGHLTEPVVVDDIRDLAQRSPGELRRLAGLRAHEHPTLVSGGPPCQGFSGIGHRRTHSDVEKHEIVSNHLYEQMVAVISALEPDAFLFENVRGILSAKWDRSGELKREGCSKVWDSVRKHFLDQLGGRYVIAFQLVRSFDYGVPQNRPRVLMVGLRREKWKATSLPWNPDEVNDRTRAGVPSAIEVGLLPKPMRRKGFPPDLRELLADLNHRGWYDARTAAGRRGNDTYATRARNDWQRAFRAMFPKERAPFSRSAHVSEQEYSNHSKAVQDRFKRIRLHYRNASVHVPRTKKFAQRYLPPTWESKDPHITIASLPDDFVHFDADRAPTVREWARLQGFPDWYEFDGPRTTGGHRRAGDVKSGDSVRETPKYTQIGNAVPVQLAAAVGRHIMHLLQLKVDPTLPLPKTRYARLLAEGFGL